MIGYRLTRFPNKTGTFQSIFSALQIVQLKTVLLSFTSIVISEISANLFNQDSLPSHVQLHFLFSHAIMQVITCIEKELKLLSSLSTSERILDAAIQLVSEKGYAAATTRSIAELAGVNEVTVFRHFGNKRGILKAIIDRFSYGPVFQKTIQFDITYDLETDLLHFSKKYFQTMLPVKDLVLIAFKEAGTFPEIDEEIANVPRFLKEQLAGYFQEMKKRGRLLDINEEAASLSFIALNLGHFISYIRIGSKVTELDIQQQLKISVSIFSRGLTP